MELSLEEIKKAVREGRITAFSLDTQIIDRQSRRLEHGLLKRMRQFRGAKTKVLFSEIVARELKAHLVSDADKAQTGLRKALKDSEDSADVSAAAAGNTLAELIGSSTADAIADGRWARFVEGTDAKIILADPSTVPEVLDRYFSKRPPFGESKRYEFPDAFALLSLEKWAEQHDTWGLVVSGDGDWKSFCLESSRLVILDDLGAALGCFQDETADYYCRELADSLRQGDRFGLASIIKKAVMEQESQIEVSLEGESQFSIGEEYAEHSVEFVGIQSSGYQDAIEPVEFDGKTLTALVRVDAIVHISAQFSFEKWDSIDREYLSMGTTSFPATEEIDLEVLVTITGDFERAPSIVATEVQPQNVHLTFTDLEPDWMRYREAEDR